MGKKKVLCKVSDWEPEPNIFAEHSEDWKDGYMAAVGGMESGKIPLPTGRVFVSIPDDVKGHLTMQQYAFMRQCTPKECFAVLARVACEYGEKVLAEFKAVHADKLQEVEEDEEVGFTWDDVMSVIRKVYGVGDKTADRIDEAVRREFDT